MISESEGVKTVHPLDRAPTTIGNHTYLGHYNCICIFQIQQVGWHSGVAFDQNMKILDKLFLICLSP
jgi:hypothetical protein